jgi:hypothetical protein
MIETSIIMTITARPWRTSIEAFGMSALHSEGACPGSRGIGVRVEELKVRGRTAITDRARRLNGSEPLGQRSGHFHGGASSNP